MNKILNYLIRVFYLDNVFIRKQIRNLKENFILKLFSYIRPSNYNQS